MKDVFQKNVFFRKGICKEIKLNCYSFLQPFASIHGNYFKQPIKGAIEARVLNVKENIKLRKKFEELKHIDGIIDITNALDNESKLSYVDGVHYSPSANKAIAIRIFEIIL